MGLSLNQEKQPLIILNDDRVLWHVAGSLGQGLPLAYVRGYATSGEGFLEDATLAQYVQQLAIQGEQELYAAIPRLNGGWGMVVVWPCGRMLAAVDRMRSVPLFFYHSEDGLAIADSALELSRRFTPEANVRGHLAYLLFGYTTGSDTLYKGIQQIQPGEIVTYRPTEQCSLWKTRYYRFYPSSISSASEKSYGDELAGVIDRMFSRFREGYQGERVLVPLSGGMDSRLIAGMLKRNGIDNCLCFTYGDESSEESRLSRYTAEALGFEWRCFRYTEEACAQWSVSEQYRSFMRYACKGVSKPNDHDYAAVMQMADEGLCGPNSIFFPGHSADMNAGSHIPPDYPDLYAGTLSVVDEIIRHHANLLWFEPKKMLRTPAAAGILAEIKKDSVTPSGHANNPLAACEMWNAEQRQSKYIINCVRTYEFVGSRWRTLWDYEFMDFFLRVPDELRYGQRLWLDCLNRNIFVNELAALAEIPIPGHGPLKSITSLKAPAKRSTRIGRLKNSIRRSARWNLWRAGFRNRRYSDEEPRKNTVIRLRGFGIDDGSISFEKGLERIGALNALKPEVREALRPWFRFRLDSVPWFAVYAVMALAETSRDSNS